MHNSLSTNGILVYKIEMIIQIFGKPKCFNTRKAERYFKERGIPFQSINLLEKGFSPGEFRSIVQALGSIDELIDPDANGYGQIAWLVDSQRADMLYENPKLLRTPIVRNGNSATVGYDPETWKEWL